MSEVQPTAVPQESVVKPGVSNRHQQWQERRRSWLSFAIYLLARVIYSTLRVRVEGIDRLPPSGQGSILVSWHGRTLIPANLLRNRGYWALISLSRDGELQNLILRRAGFQTVRGSTGRGGIRGALQMARKVREGGTLAFTPDGPRGPTHKVQLGVILMAEKSGAPIIPVGISASSRWLLTRSWDSYLIPKPFARAYVLFGDPIFIPPGLDEAGRAARAREVEVAINRLECLAEQRAGFAAYPVEWPTA
jgi:lysophospholipid acyltransferase (LPLAT)-like uncharacterized protein